MGAKHRKKKKLRLGTDCSGTDSPVYAIKNTALYKKKKISLVHEFSCDILPSAQEFIMRNHSPKVLYDNMLTRDHSKLAQIDLYVNGFPCQPWSSLGKKKGWKDIRMRVYKSMLKTLKANKPKAIVLENVARLAKTKKGEVLEKILQDLQKLGYSSLDWKLYNSKHFGVPQSRSRLYLLGVRGNKQIQLPAEPKTEPPKLTRFLDAEIGTDEDRPRSHSHCGKMLKAYMKLLKKKDTKRKAWVVDIDASPKFAMAKEELCPTLTRSRACGYFPI